MGMIAKAAGGVALLAVIGAVLTSQDDAEESQASGESTSAKTSEPATPPASVDSNAPVIDKSEAMQKGRRELIDKLIAQGVFQKVEIPGNLPRLWVQPAFHELDFDAKQKFTSVVYAYYVDSGDVSASVRLYDSKTGKEIGSFAAYHGGLELF